MSAATIFVWRFKGWKLTPNEMGGKRAASPEILPVHLDPRDCTGLYESLLENTVRYLCVCVCVCVFVCVCAGGGSDR